ncbi:MutT/NUDIX family protein [Alteracholeplasma palmae J233]|uniref:MutT/NUDIX family protein n=1 Tax=Alteracholeplasma palmae (strain ATCC 49389 / J233) TaxID=1318466 RepID=U4KQC4_ALTPJ|nr:8-oxo-dGTP diphosphatase [Alteracholeplasma palmae]CCV64500.1 MutT/NUDIX family protein [Alteracholeplasma palmae J233]
MDRTEKCILTNMCMVYKGDEILVLDRIDPNWKGLTFPGGHVEKDESFNQSVIREVFEETGLTIKNPRICGMKQFTSKNKEYRYIVFLYKTNEFEGELQSSNEGKVFWINKNDLEKYQAVPDFHELYEIFNKEELSENFNYFDEIDNKWRYINS